MCFKAVNKFIMEFNFFFSSLCNKIIGCCRLSAHAIAMLVYEHLILPGIQPRCLNRFHAGVLFIRMADVILQWRNIQANRNESFYILQSWQTWIFNFSRKHSILWWIGCNHGKTSCIDSPWNNRHYLVFSFSLHCLYLVCWTVT